LAGRCPFQFCTAHKHLESSKTGKLQQISVKGCVEESYSLIAALTEPKPTPAIRPQPPRVRILLSSQSAQPTVTAPATPASLFACRQKSISRSTWNKLYRSSPLFQIPLWTIACWSSHPISLRFLGKSEAQRLCFFNNLDTVPDASRNRTHEVVPNADCWSPIGFSKFGRLLILLWDEYPWNRPELWGRLARKPPRPADKRPWGPNIAPPWPDPATNRHWHEYTKRRITPQPIDAYRNPDTELSLNRCLQQNKGFCGVYQFRRTREASSWLSDARSWD
jgi:hypothetical protein